MDDTNDIEEVDQQRGTPTRDPFLGVLVALADNDPTLEVSVTLSVPGGVVTGMLVNAQAWCEQAAVLSGNETAATIYRTYKRLLEEGTDDDPEGDVLALEFVHLRDARIFSGGQPVPGGDTGLFWRGRLSEITGWAVGVLGRGTA